MEEMTSMDRRTRKILAMNGCLHTRSNVAVPAEEGRGKRIDWNRGECKKGKKIPVWLFKGEHRVDASSGTEGEGSC